MLLLGSSLGAVVINEVADSGSPDFCSEDDWIEIANTEGTPVDISGWKLCDSDGCGDSDAYTFGAGTTLGANAHLAVCHLRSDGLQQNETRWIGEDDSLTLHESDGTLVDSTGVLGGDGKFGKTWARDPDMTGAFAYTWKATPSEANAFPTGPASDCARLATEGYDCSACVDASINQHASCDANEGQSAAEDNAREELAIFGNKGPKDLWTQTNFLFKDDTVWNVELVLSDDSWDRMREDPGAEEYEVGVFRIRDGDGELRGEWPDVGVRFKGFFGSLRLCLVGWEEVARWGSRTRAAAKTTSACACLPLTRLSSALAPLCSATSSLIRSSSTTSTASSASSA